MHAGWQVTGQPRIALDDVAKAHDDFVAGRPLPSWVQHSPARYWDRSRQLGVDPHGGSSVVLSAAELERRRREFRLAPALGILWAGLEGVAGGERTVEVTDEHGYVLHRKGDRNSKVYRRANETGFCEGACMAIPVMGENGIGNVLECGEPTQIVGPFHYRRNQHGFTCSAAPVMDPRHKSKILAVINIGDLAPYAHPDTLRLLRNVADNVSRRLASVHRKNVGQLCAHVGRLDRVTGWALVTDRDGWVAASHGLTEPPERVTFPEGHHLQPGRCQLLELDPSCVLEPLPGGWLIRPEVRGEDDPVIQVVLESRNGEHWMTVAGRNVTWEHRLTPIQAKILKSLAIAHRHGGGRTGAELAEELYGRGTQVSHQICRIREYAGGLLDPERRAPYRFADAVRVAIP